MTPKQAIIIVISVGALVALYVWYDKRRASAPAIAPSLSNWFTANPTIPEPLNRPMPIDAPILGNAIPRDPTITYPNPTNDRGH